MEGNLHPGLEVFAERRVRLVGATASGRPGVISAAELGELPAVVLLGDPGAGKTTFFRLEAERLRGPAPISVSLFLHLPPQELQGSPLFLDSLDEARSSRGDRHDTLERITARLIELGRPRFRLSCRTGDWLGERERECLARAAPGEIVVAELLPLSRSEMRTIVQAQVADSAFFMAQVSRHGMAEWLGNPQTLQLLVTAARKGTLPTVRQELFAKACEVMAMEVSPIRRQAHPEPPCLEATLETAGYLSALLLICGLEGFDRSLVGEVERGFAPCEGMGVGPKERDAALASRLFTWEGDRVRPVHRMVAEYLAACELRRRMLKGLPFLRVLRLITGFDGGSLSDLRGLFGWLGTLAMEHSEVMARIDPLALVAYGDAEPLAPSRKRALLSELEKQTDFPRRSIGYGWPDSLRSLADCRLVTDFRSVLSAAEAPDRSLTLILTILSRGPSLPELAGDLGVLIHRELPEATRQLALRAWMNCGVSEAALLGLLEEIEEGRCPDAEDELRGALLDRLYPAILQPEWLGEHLTPPKAPQLFGAYRSFVDQLSEKTDDAAVARLLDVIARLERWSPPVMGRSATLVRFSWGRPVGRLLRRGLELHGGIATVERIWAWLGIASGFGGQSLLEKEDRQAVASWFSLRPERLAELYSWRMTQGATGEPYARDGEFWTRTGYPHALEFWRIQLSMAENAGAEPHGTALFRLAWKRLESRSENLTAREVDELFAWVERHPGFRSEAAALSVVRLPSRPLRIPTVGAEREPEDDKEAIRARNRQVMAKNIEAVRSGNDVGLLDHLAKIYLDVARRPGLVEVKIAMGEEIAAAAQEGFEALLDRTDLPTPTQVGEAYRDQQRYHGSLALAAAMELRHQEGRVPLTLEVRGARAALANYLVGGVAHPGSAWQDEIIRQQPREAAEVALDAWAPLLAGNVLQIDWLYGLNDHPNLQLELGLPLLRRYPRSRADILLELARAAIAVAPGDALAALAIEQGIHLEELDVRQAAIWLAVGLLAEAEPASDQARLHIQVYGAEEAIRLAEYLRDLGGKDYSRLKALSSASLVGLVHPLGESCPPQPLPEEDLPPAFEAAQFVQRLAGFLAERTDEAAVQGLQRMSADAALLEWRRVFLELVERQRLKAREERHQNPSLAAIVRALANGLPASSGDLQALVADQLRSLGRHLRDAAGSGYRRYWNVDSYNRPERPVPENAVRDQLIGSLAPWLARAGVSAEPEAQYAGETRADIKAIAGLFSVPVEIKRNSHADLWTAPEQQLKAQYLIDPACDGFGIFLVFWFGEIEGHCTPKPPSDATRPASAGELEATLRQLHSGEAWRKVEFICLDCSHDGGPPPKSAKKTASKPKRKGSKSRASR